MRGTRADYALGFQAKGVRYGFLGAKAFGHDGSAGSESFATRSAGIAFGGARRRLGFAWSCPGHDRLAVASTTPPCPPRGVVLKAGHAYLGTTIPS
ncbi:hypothetical protein AB0K12_37240 [Nonomuraea sp. NPDC049419]|uniref:hypothetical protein n=1 Tax=Nonomuraea sp. NPDC049419 TaxID=3155772 RepID=UPI00341FE8BF